MKALHTAVGLALFCAVCVGCHGSRPSSAGDPSPTPQHRQGWLAESRQAVQHWASTSRQDLEHWADEVFLDSAKAGSRLLTKSLLMLDVSPHIRDVEQRTALMYAALHGHSDIVQLLLDLGVGINIYDRNGWSPLMLAAWNGHAQSAQLLLEYGARVNVLSPSDVTALMAATTRGHTALVSLFLDYGADIHGVHQSGAHLLLRAASRGYTDIVQVLLTHGARTATQDAYGWTALTEAMWNNQPATATLLLTAPDMRPGTLDKEYDCRLSQAESKRSYHRAPASQRNTLACRGDRPVAQDRARRALSVTT
jgi:ankyrin repeat protein